MSEQGEVDGMK